MTKRSASTQGFRSLWNPMSSFVPALVLILLATQAQAIVLHRDSENNLCPEATDTPAVDVVGKYMNALHPGESIASAVAIGREGWTSTNYIITTKHQPVYTDLTKTTTIWFGATEYKVAQYWEHATSDLRICRMETMDGQNANLSDFTLWNSSIDETAGDGIDIVMGGYGLTCGDRGVDSFGNHYYTWAGNAAITSLHWGTNHVDSTEIYPPSTAVLKIDFDPLDATIEDKPTIAECAIAEYDSGGGWFYKQDDTWYLVALGAYPDARGKSYYEGNDVHNLGVRISPYDNWINTWIPATPEPATLGCLGIGGLILLRNRSRRVMKRPRR